MNNKIVILGAGESGVGSAVLAKKKGFSVFVSDYGSIKQKYINELNDNNITWEQNNHCESEILSAYEIIKSPGIPDSAAIIVAAKEKGIAIISEIEFAGRYTKAKTICITGSNGKTTTSLLIYHMFIKAGLNVGLAGNIGFSFARQVANENFDYYIIELSSFQLDGMYDFKADIAILLNITPDHLDRYEYKMENYVDSKFRIIQNMTEHDSFIYFDEDKEMENILTQKLIKANKIPFSCSEQFEYGAFLEGEEFKIELTNYSFSMFKKDLSLTGRHNIYNSMAAGIAGSLAGIRKDVIRESLSDFTGVEHRLEKLINVRGIHFINDSKATNINSTWYALESMDREIVWIVGGVDKGNDYSILDDLVVNNVKAIICLGIDNKKIHEAFKDKIKTIIDVSSMKEAVRSAYYLANKNQVVLLSPACASFDLFTSYEDRGNQFKAEVRDL